MPSTVASLLAGTKIPIRENVMRHVTLELYDLPITASSDVAHTSTFIAKTVAGWTARNETDEELLYTSQEEFQNWTPELFKRAELDGRKLLKQALREGGVYLPQKGAIETHLLRLLREQDLPEWPESELLEVKSLRQDTKAFQRRQNSRIKQEDPMTNRQPVNQVSGNQLIDITPNVTPNEVTSTIEDHHGNAERPNEANSMEGQGMRSRVRFEPTRPPQSFMREQADTGDQRQTPWQNDRYTPSRQTPGVQATNYNDANRQQYQYLLPPFTRDSMLPEEKPFDWYRSMPRPGITYGQQPLDIHKITSFAKIFDDKDKYAGEMYDILDDKVLVFLDICESASILPAQFCHVLSRMLSGKARDFLLHHAAKTDDFGMQFMKIKLHFEHEVHHRQYFTDWTSTSSKSIQMKAENQDKQPLQILEILLDKMQLCQRALGPRYQGEEQLRAAVLKAVQGITESNYALLEPKQTCEELFGQIRSALTINSHTSVSAMITDSYTADNNDNFFVDRNYNYKRGRGGYKGGGNSARGGYRGSNTYGMGRENGNTNRRQSAFETGSRGQERGNADKQRGTITWDKRCFICNKTGCWSTRHSIEERRKAKQYYLLDINDDDVDTYAAYLLDHEGDELDDVGLPEQSTTHDLQNTTDNVTYLTNAAFMHRMTGEDIFSTIKQDSNMSHSFVIEDRYAAHIWQGIMPDSGAAMTSTAGRHQYLALKRHDPSTTLDTSQAGGATIQFGPGKAVSSIGTVTVGTAIGNIMFSCSGHTNTISHVFKRYG